MARKDNQDRKKASRTFKAIRNQLKDRKGFSKEIKSKGEDPHRPLIATSVRLANRMNRSINPFHVEFVEGDERFSAFGRTDDVCDESIVSP